MRHQQTKKQQQADTCVNNPADFKFSQIEEAYDVFTRAAETKALKVNLEF